MPIAHGIGQLMQICVGQPVFAVSAIYAELRDAAGNQILHAERRTADAGRGCHRCTEDEAGG